VSVFSERVMRASRCRITLLLFLGGAGCATRAAPPPSSPAKAEPPIVVDCSRRHEGAFRDWHDWRTAKFGYPLDLAGPTPFDLGLLYLNLRETEHMLRRGLEACDDLAPQVLEQMHLPGWVPALRDVLPQSRGGFRVAVVVALHELDRERRYGAHLADLLVEPCWSDNPLEGAACGHFKLEAVLASRRFPREEVSPSLLQMVRTDPRLLVRIHAKENLLALWKINPPIAVERELSVNISSLAVDQSKPERPPTEAELARFQRAAEILQGLIEQPGKTQR
jgi:hypothetical protein